MIGQPLLAAKKLATRECSVYVEKDVLFAFPWERGSK